MFLMDSVLYIILLIYYIILYYIIYYVSDIECVIPIEQSEYY